MALDPRLTPELRSYLQQLNERILPRSRARGQKTNVINVREAMLYAHNHFLSRDIPIAYRVDDTLPSEEYPLPVRLYHPAPAEALGVIVFFHGGGGVAGSVSVYEGIHRRLAQATRHIVVAVEYRLAPENRYPAAQHDALQAARHVWRVLEARKLNYKPFLHLIGDSAGGGLCAVVASAARDDPKLRLSSQVLLYPHLSHTLDEASIAENGEDYYLRRETLQWYIEQVLPPHCDAGAASPLALPINPALPTLLVTVERDPLRDAGLAYAAKLHKQHVKYEHIHRDDVVHGYLGLERLCMDACQETYHAIARFIAAQES